MKNQLNTVVDNAVLIAAFWSAIIVALVTFTRDAWKSNNMAEKTRKATLIVVRLLDTISETIRDNIGVAESVEIAPAPVTVAKVSTKRPKRT